MGKRILIFIFLGAVALHGTVPLALNAQNESGGVENIFSYGTGLRALGMGSAFTAMTEDPYLGYWNPGAMAYNQYMEVAAFGTRLIADTYYLSAYYTHPTTRFGTLSFGGIGVYTNGIESYDENASPITDTSTSYFQYQLLLSYGYGFKFGLGIGGTVKVEQIRITDFKGAGASFDIGVYYKPKPIPWLALGAVIQDMYGTGIKLVDEFEQNTRIIKFGVATHFPLGEKSRISLALDTRFFKDNYNSSSGNLIYDFSFGSEVTFFDEALALRAGVANLEPGAIALPAGLSFGIGGHFIGIGVDYAITFSDSDWQETLDLIMRLGLSYRFGKSMDERRQAEAQDVQDQINAAIAQATEQFDEERRALQDEHDTEVSRIKQDYDDQIGAVINDSQLTIEQKEEIISNLEQEREADLSAVTATLTGQITELNSQLEEQRIGYEQALLDLEARYEIEQQQITDIAAQKSRLYADGLQAFSEGRYKDAESAFREVSALDPEYLRVEEYIGRSQAMQKEITDQPDQIKQLYREGLDLFVKKQYQAAIDKWEEILAIDPYNKLATQNIQEAQRRLRKLEELGIEEGAPSQ
jgi:tetratricopeptide (TPR) repeat protein